MELVDSCVAESRNDLGRERPEGYGCDFKGTRRPRQGIPQHFLWDPCAYVFSLWFPTDGSRADLSLIAKNGSYSSDAGDQSLVVTVTTSATCTSVISAFFFQFILLLAARSPKELLLDAFHDERLVSKERKLCLHGHNRIIEWNEACASTVVTLASIEV